jgi:pyruvate,orthophosphate dikinase
VDEDLLSRSSLRRVTHLLERFREGLELSGIDNEGLRSHLGMLDASLRLSDFSLAQFVNLFQFVAQNLREIMHDHFLGHHERILPVVLRQHLLDEDPGPGDERAIEAEIHARSEEFYRELLAQALLVGQLDSFVAYMLDRLNDMAARVPAVLVQRLIDFELDRAVTSLDEARPDVDNPVFLGGKGHFLKKLHSFGYPVPPGFILTTEVFRIHDAFAAYPELEHKLAALVDERLGDLERTTGRRLGDPADPLLVSVRSAAAMSMPGAMSTFVNVGLNDAIVERLGERPNLAWTAWDCYRRLLQGWGMAHGVPRDDFDQIIADFKQRFAVREKVHFQPDQMRAIADAYRERLARSGIELEQDPRAQLAMAIRFVLESWDAPVARAYRDRLLIADKWGTSVIVQHMVLGNLGSDSGTGVVFTSDPFAADLGVTLYGDFTTGSQGEDVVAGLVHPWPVSSHQRQQADTADGRCLEVEFPEIHAELERLARDLVLARGFGHQEIEFTFESSRREDLYVLQTRDHSWQRRVSVPVFEGPGLAPLASGVGIGGGAMNGVVAFDAGDLERLAAEDPATPRVLVRRDTVPDDIGMIFACEGLLTARGGVTSHAGVTASRLGKTCVVNCRSLDVDESAKVCRVQGTEFRPGDRIAIDGSQGTIYAGHFPIAATRAAGD